MRVENGGGGDLIIDEEGSNEASNVLQRRQELCLDRRERGGRQATHFSVPSNKSRYDGQRGQKGRHAAAATHSRRLVVSGISTSLVERVWMPRLDYNNSKNVKYE